MRPWPVPEQSWANMETRDVDSRAPFAALTSSSLSSRLSCLSYFWRPSRSRFRRPDIDLLPLFQFHIHPDLICLRSIPNEDRLPLESHKANPDTYHQLASRMRRSRGKQEILTASTTPTPAPSTSSHATSRITPTPLPLT